MPLRNKRRRPHRNGGMRRLGGRLPRLLQRLLICSASVRKPSCERRKLHFKRRRKRKPSSKRRQRRRLPTSRRRRSRGEARREPREQEPSVQERGTLSPPKQNKKPKQNPVRQWMATVTGPDGRTTPTPSLPLPPTHSSPCLAFQADCQLNKWPRTYAAEPTGAVSCKTTRAV